MGDSAGREVYPCSKPAPARSTAGVSAVRGRGGSTVDQTYLLLLAIALVVAACALGAMLLRPRKPATPNGPDATFAVSTEGMKICPKCGMGNLWTDRSCVSCRAPLKG